MQAQLAFVHALSPLHAGTGQGVGVIDLPLAREKATGIPFLPGSSLKGTLRDRCTDENACKRIFGPPTDRADEHAGAAHFSDQRLLLLPVRSLKGTFAWVTSPYLLQRLRRDASEVKLVDVPTAPPTISKVDQCIIAAKPGALCLSSGKVVLEDLDLTASEGGKNWAEWLGKRLFADDNDKWRTRLTERLCIVHDDVLAFLLNTATEVTARIKLDDDAKTVDTKTGALWTEEALPAETVLAGLVFATPVKQSGAEADKVLQDVAKLAGTMQLGGKATVGRGLCRVLLS